MDPATPPAAGPAIDIGIPADSREATSVPAATDRIRQLVEGREAVVRTARRVLRTAEKAGDQVTTDLLTQRMQVHEKAAWMLRSLLA